MVGPLGGIGLSESSLAWSLYRGVLYLGIVSGVTGALVPPVACKEGTPSPKCSSLRSAVWGVYVAGRGEICGSRGRSLSG